MLLATYDVTPPCSFLTRAYSLSRFTAKMKNRDTNSEGDEINRSSQNSTSDSDSVSVQSIVKKSMTDNMNVNDATNTTDNID